MDITVMKKRTITKTFDVSLLPQESTLHPRKWRQFLLGKRVISELQAEYCREH
jgi:hypothetical protein